MSRRTCRRCGDMLKLIGVSRDIIHTNWGHFECRSGHVELMWVSDREYEKAEKELNRDA